MAGGETCVGNSGGSCVGFASVAFPCVAAAAVHPCVDDEAVEESAAVASVPSLACPIHMTSAVLNDPPSHFDLTKRK